MAENTGKRAPKRGEVALYVPRGRRELIEKKKSEDIDENVIQKDKKPSQTEEATQEENDSLKNISSRLDSLKIAGKQEELIERRRQAFFSSEDQVPSNTRNETTTPRRTPEPVPVRTVERPIVDDSEFRDYISDEKLLSYCLVIESLPYDLTDGKRQQIPRPYEDVGASTSWLTPRDCLLVFLNESQTRKAMSIGCLSYRAIPLETSIVHNNQSVLAGKLPSYFPLLSNGLL